jgi:hypothetical protein
MLSRLIQINGNREDLLLKHIKDDDNYRKLI